MTSRFVRTALLLFFSSVIATLGTATYIYRTDIQQARDRVATGSSLAHTSCGPIEYAVTGDGPPVLVVHGAGGGFDQGLDFGEPLAKLGLRIIAMSRFGYLRTPLPPDASPAAQADAHACLLDALGIEKVAIVGGSAGAPSSMQFALRHPARLTALVLVVPATFVPRPGNAPALHTPPETQVLFETALKWDVVFWAVNRLAPDAVIRSILATPPDLVREAAPEEQARANLYGLLARLLYAPPDTGLLQAMAGEPFET